MSRIPAVQHCKDRAGFTLVELLAALLAGAVLVAVMGAMLWYGFLGLNRTRNAVTLQRDMRASMVALSQMTHSATGMHYNTSGVYTVWFSNHPPARVYVSSTTNLFYDPDTTGSGAEMQLAYGTLRTFSVAVATNLAAVVLALGDGFETASNEVFLFRRN